MKKYALSVAVALFAHLALAASPVEGEYLCEGCKGYMNLKKNPDNTYQVRLVVSAGSCAGDEFAKGTYPLVLGKKFLIPWKQKKRKCATMIEIEGNKAYVSDSCISPEDEASTTCAVLGEYSKRVTEH